MKKPFVFNEAYQELEKIVAWFERDDLDLDEGLKKFEKGVEVATQLKSYLRTVENRVEKIQTKFSQPDEKIDDL